MLTRAFGSNLRRVFGSIALGAASLLGWTTPNPTTTSIDARVANVRAELERRAASQTLEGTDSSQLPAHPVAQWVNWGNWANWANWANWNNWANWLNWFNG